MVAFFCADKLRASETALVRRFHDNFTVNFLPATAFVDFGWIWDTRAAVVTFYCALFAYPKVHVTIDNFSTRTFAAALHNGITHNDQRAHVPAYTDTRHTRIEPTGPTELNTSESMNDP